MVYVCCFWSLTEYDVQFYDQEHVEPGRNTNYLVEIAEIGHGSSFP